MKEEQVNIKAPVCCLMTSRCEQVDPHHHLRLPASHAAERRKKLFYQEHTKDTVQFYFIISIYQKKHYTFLEHNLNLPYFVCISKGIQLCHRLSKLILNMKQKKTKRQ